MKKENGVEFEYEHLEDGVNINHFFVDIDKRGNGRGSEVIQSLIDRFEDQGYNYVVVNMGGGEGSREFLRRNGFEIVEFSEDHVTAETDL